MTREEQFISTILSCLNNYISKREFAKSEIKGLKEGKKYDSD